MISAIGRLNKNWLVQSAWAATKVLQKLSKSRLVVFGAVYDCLMHQCAFEEAVRALKSDVILLASRPTANRFVRAMAATPGAAAYWFMPPSFCALGPNTDPCRPFLAT